MCDETSDWNILIVLLKSLKDEGRRAGKIISFSEPKKICFSLQLFVTLHR